MVMEKERGGRAKDGGHQGRQAKITPVAAYMFVVMRMDVIVQAW